MMSTCSRFRVLAVAALLVGVPAAARKPGPLPSFTLTALDGKSVSSSQLHLPNHWLLMYVHRDTGSGAQVINALRGDTPAALGQQVIIVVGGAQPADVTKYAKSFPHMAQVTWYADPQWTVLAALKVQASPFVLGFKDNTIQWQLIGTLRNPAQLHSILKTWKEKKN